MFHFNLLTSCEKIVSTMVDRAVVPGAEGILELLPHHMPFMCSLSKGNIHVHTQGTTHTYAIEQGVLYFLNNQCDVFVKTP